MIFFHKGIKNYFLNLYFLFFCKITFYFVIKLINNKSDLWIMIIYYLYCFHNEKNL